MTHHLTPVIGLFAALALLVSGCDSAPPTIDTPTGVAPTTEGRASRPTATPGAEDMHIDTADVLLLESYPVQVVLHVTGSLPSPCHLLASDVRDDGVAIRVSLSVRTNPLARCTQMLTPFEERIALGSYASGARTVWLSPPPSPTLTSILS